MKYTSALLSDARNKLGESVFSKNASGGYIRAKVVPRNPQTEFQQYQRGLFSTFTKMWRTLSETQMAGWRALALTVPQKDSLGQTFYLSGSDLFVANNLNLAAADADAVLTAVPAQIPLAPVPFGELLLIVDGGFDFIAVWAVASDPTAGGAVPVFKATDGFSPGISFVPPFFYKSFFGSGDFEDGQVSYAFTPKSAYPNFVNGNKFSVQYRLVDPSSGFASPYTKVVSTISGL